MKRILAIVWKDTLVRFSSKGEWLFFVILPVVFTVVLGGGTGGSVDSRMRLMVVDRAGSPLSAELISKLEESTVVRPEMTTLERAEEALAGRRASAELVIPDDFDLQHLLGGGAALEVRQQPNSLNALAAYRAVSEAAGRMADAADLARAGVAEVERFEGFASEATREAYLGDMYDRVRAEVEGLPPRVIVEHAATQDPVEYDPLANSSAGQLITWVFIPLLGISAMFAYERRKGTLRRLLVAPVEPSTYLVGTISGQVVTALVQMLILVGFGISVMGLEWGRSPGGLAVVMVSFALAAAALGTTLGTLVRTEAQANGISIAAGMVMALLGGCWYPMDLFPAAMRTAARILPTAWAMDAMLNLVLRGQGLAAVLPHAGVLLGFAALFFVVGVWRFRCE